MRMLPSKMVLFSVTTGAFSSGRTKTIQKHKAWTRILLERRKNPEFKQKRMRVDRTWDTGKDNVRNQNKTIER